MVDDSAALPSQSAADTTLRPDDPGAPRNIEGQPKAIAYRPVPTSDAHGDPSVPLPPPGEPRIGVLMANLGSPAAPTAKALRPYLAQFLSDKRVVDYPWWFWQPILRGIILRTRPARSARAYARVWTEEGAPLIVGTRRLAEKTEAALRDEAGADIPIEIGMRYGEPSIAGAMDRLRDRGVERILVLPLYPQFSGSTTASILDAVTDAMKVRTRWPEVRWVADYASHPAYIEALAASIREAQAAQREKGEAPAERLIFSYHGIPRRYCRTKGGDPYRQQCEATSLRVAHALGLSRDQWLVTFQSRFGPEPWLEPYTDRTLEELAKGGVRHVDVVCPGFSIDCLETTDEIGLEGAESFVEAGGSALRYIGCLNDRPSHVGLMRALVQQHTAGWREWPSA